MNVREYQRLIDRADPTACADCDDTGHCAYHRGVLDGYAAAEQILEAGKR